MRLQTRACGPLEANCYILSSDNCDECVIIDPGTDAEGTIIPLITALNLTPVAVLATHGHIDHVQDAAVLANHYSIPVWIHSADRHLLSDPAAGLDRGLSVWLAMILPNGMTEPHRVELLDDKETLNLAGLEIQVIHAPGHTGGCVLYSVTEAEDTFIFTGDVLFAGAIGRTDLPGGDSTVMLETLRGPVLGLPDAARIFAGHGPSSTMAIEKTTNPYLQPRFLDLSDF